MFIQTNCYTALVTSGTAALARPARAENRSI